MSFCKFFVIWLWVLEDGGVGNFFLLRISVVLFSICFVWVIRFLYSWLLLVFLCCKIWWIFFLSWLEVFWWKYLLICLYIWMFFNRWLLIGSRVINFLVVIVWDFRMVGVLKCLCCGLMIFRLSFVLWLIRVLLSLWVNE